jgi:hypothetical protein
MYLEAATHPTNMALAMAYAETYARYKQAWIDSRYADMGMAALDLRDLLAQAPVAQQSLLA